MPLLDTTFLIDLDRKPKKHESQFEKWAQQGEDPVVPAQAAIEFSTGEANPAAALHDLRTSFWIVPLTRISNWKRPDSANGRSKTEYSPVADLQIAATARTLGMDVVTLKVDHFKSLGLNIHPHP